MDILEEEMPVINPNKMFPEEEEEEFELRSKPTSIFGSRDELNDLRARSGDEMQSEDDLDISPVASRKTSSRRPSIVSLPTGRWSRRSSLAGNEFLKMDDEVTNGSNKSPRDTFLMHFQMVQVHRSGSIVSIPRRLSHHVPTVPIIEAEDLENKVSTKFFDLESEEFQLYKTADVCEYNLVKADTDIVGKQKFPFQKKSRNFSEVEQKLLDLLEGRDASSEELLHLLKDILSEENLTLMEEMKNNGNAIEKIIAYFLEKGELRKSHLSDKIKFLLGKGFDVIHNFNVRVI